MRERSLSRRSVYSWIKVFVIPLVIFVAIFFNPFVRPIGALDVSLPYRVFLELRVFEEIERGDYVEIYVGDMDLPKEGVRFLIKKVVCKEGDFLLVEGDAYFCNGEKVAEAYRGAFTERFIYKGEVPKGKYFVVGEHPKSYDSKYMGFVDRSRIVAKVVPLF